MLFMPLMNSTVPQHGRCFLYVSSTTLEPHSSLASQWHYRLFREPDDPGHCSEVSWVRRTLLTGCIGLRAALWVPTSGLGGLCCSLDSGIVLTVVTSVLQKKHLSALLLIPVVPWVVDSAHLMFRAQDRHLSVVFVTIWGEVSLLYLLSPLQLLYMVQTWSPDCGVVDLGRIWNVCGILCIERNIQCDLHFV